MMRRAAIRTVHTAVGRLQARPLSSNSHPRHLMSVSDLSPAEFTKLVLNASSHKSAIKTAIAAGQTPHSSLAGQSVALLFSKRSTRTRVSTEAAVALMGGHPMFLGKDDIQLGINESLRDTSTVISSMTSCMVARVGAHSEITGLAEHSSVPVINALSEDFHPLQTLADFQTIHEALPERTATKTSLGLEGLKVAWVGDCNNVCIDLATACVKMGVDIAIASPTGYGVPDRLRPIILSSPGPNPVPGKLFETTIPEEAVKDADIIVTDTWISMGQEAETKDRLKAFAGYQVTNELAKRGGAKPDWKFLHCLPRHQEEVDDEVFYGPRSLVFQEGENRLWAALATLEAFVINKGKIV
ncbi:putative ornithine CARBAMOYLtransferase precursor [Lasiosphaeria hispida]|uniref:Ornithine carbamoyltransferase, mitochondrial n=1 Tax=Lasiosphaeria hispida TaxID=260671 RepID=A0AAJ0H948_9PEZI|nr:putative ornithine CARBAMOYLtransferase precursor [Lasiosphaeria hispida]